MERFLAYIEAIEGINIAERRHATKKDAISLALLGSAVDAAKAAWLFLPVELRSGMVPPPRIEDYC
jgi:hypothetical protein